MIYFQSPQKSILNEVFKKNKYGILLWQPEKTNMLTIWIFIFLSYFFCTKARCDWSLQDGKHCVVCFLGDTFHLPNSCWFQSLSLY